MWLRQAALGHNTRHSAVHLMDQNTPGFPGSIETPRLVLRAPDSSDAEAMFASYTQDADVARYMVWQPHVSLEATRDFVDGCVAHWDSRSALPYIITLKASGQLIGMLEARPHGHVVNIGYVLARSQWGQGLMGEAVQAFTAIALRLPEVFASRQPVMLTIDPPPGPWKKAALCSRAGLPDTPCIRISLRSPATALSTQRVDRR